MFDESEEPVRVAVGVIKKNDTYLLCQRGINRRYAMRWEFPGGKMYPDEAPLECLQRELEEELEIRPVKTRELTTVRATYGDGGDFLITYFLVTEFEGEPKNRVFERIAWVKSSDFGQYDILEGTRPVLRHL